MTNALRGFRILENLGNYWVLRFAVFGYCGMKLEVVALLRWLRASASIVWRIHSLTLCPRWDAKASSSANSGSVTFVLAVLTRISVLSPSPREFVGFANKTSPVQVNRERRRALSVLEMV
jgi:hypothetical protein